MDVFSARYFHSVQTVDRQPTAVVIYRVAAGTENQSALN